MQSKLLAFHVEADDLPTLLKAIDDGKSKVAAKIAASAPEAKPESKPAAPAAESKAKLPDVMNALTAYKNAVDAPDKGKAKKGLAAVKEVLAVFGVTNSKDLKADQYDAVVAAAEKALADFKPADGDDF